MTKTSRYSFGTHPHGTLHGSNGAIQLAFLPQAPSHICVPARWGNIYRNQKVHLTSKPMGCHHPSFECLRTNSFFKKAYKKESPNLNSFNPPLCSRTEQLPSSALVFPDLAPAPAEAPPRPPASPAWRRFRGPRFPQGQESGRAKERSSEDLRMQGTGSRF